MARHRQRGRLRSPLSLLAVALLGFCLAVGASAAFASEGVPDYGPGTTLEQLEQGIDPAAPNILDEPTTNPQAAQELPHDDLGRAEALDLMTSVFSPTLERTAGVFGELDGARLLSTNVAVVDASSSPEGGASPGSVLLESAVPLSADGSLSSSEIVSLDLEHAQEELQPENPLVEVGIPGELGEGISLPAQQVTIDVPGAPSERGPSTISDSSAFYPNVAADTDIVVAPTPTGVETFSQLRTPDAPQNLQFDLELPQGATLEATEEGGAVVRDGDEIQVLIHPPTALDANGADIPVELSVAGHSILLEVSPSVDAAYPILVDPLYETFDWEKHYGGENYDWAASHVPMPGWVAETTSPAYSLRNWNIGEYAGRWGAAITSGWGEITPGSRARWKYYVPKYFTDYAKYGVRPTTYIDRVTLKELQYRFSSANPSRQYSPYFYGGIFDVTTDNFVALASRTGVEGQLTDPAYHYQFHNPNQNGNAKGFGIYLASNEFDSTPPERHLWASFATITLADPDKPKFDVLGMPSQWMNDEPLGTIPFSASDQGLGVSKISLANPRSVNVPLVTSIKQGCVGGAEKPCPKSWSSSASGSPQLSYDPSVMPQGENWIVVNAHDPAGRTSADGGPAPQIRVKVDHTAPTVKFSGTLADQSTSPPRPDYTLKYAASDGFDATPSGLTPILPSGTGEAKPQRPLGIAADGKGNIWMVDRENGRIVKYNEAGSYLGQFGTYGSGPGQFLDPRGIAVAPDGTIWVADAARGRIQQFNAKGEYLRGFGAKSSVPTNDPWGFVEAWGVAVAPDGKIWVSDPGAGRVAIFDPSAEPTGPPNFVADAVGTPSDPTKKAELVGPLALAPDASGNVWVVEHGAHRVDAFNSAGKFLMRFGSEGVGDGQFKGPVGIALAPTGHLLVTDAGNHRVQVFLPSGAYLRQFASYGQDGENLNEPRGIALGAGNTAFIADAGSRRIARWDGVDVDPQSGVVSTEIKVDGNAVEPKHAPGCSTKNCSISREWTVGANDYNSGQHKVEVTAIDGVGLSNTRSLTLTTDDTPPQITSSGKFFTSPGGWLEQKGYFYSVYATDAGGFGVTSLVFKIDGSVVWSQSQECVQGGCSAGGLRWTDMTPYDGGAHAAEVIATDIAGNVRKKTWTINVSPKGEIPVSETVDTLEALEETSAANAIGEAKEEGEVIGSAAGLGLEEEEGEIVSAGSQVPLTVAESPDGGLTLEVVENPDAQIDDPAAEELPEVLPVTIEPVQTSDQASQSTVIGGNATVAADTGSHVDTVVRPLADGGMTFQNIRDALGPESFSWEVQLYPEQQLKWIDDTHAGVFVDDHLIFSINATAAHDAVGTNVSTKLTVSGSNIITLTVQHRATSFVYPVIAGTGWQGGFVTSTVEMPPPESPPEEEGQGGMETFAVVSAPEPAGTGDPNDATASKISTYVKRYGFYACETLPEGCPVWKHKIKGFFFYNGRHAWWKDRHPVCEHSEAPNVSISVHYCDWIGPNHQPYGNGYHITSQTRFEVTKTLKAIDFSKSHALTVRMYGSGGWYGGGHARVCNPSRPECA